jgi:hypothetical protein
VIPNVYSEYSEHYFRDRQRVISKSTYPIAWYYYNLLPSQWLAIWRIFRRSPLSEDKYPNRNPAWKQALLIIDFQGNTRKDSSTSLSDAHEREFRIATKSLEKGSQIILDDNAEITAFMHDFNRAEEKLFESLGFSSTNEKEPGRRFHILLKSPLKNTNFSPN